MDPAKQTILITGAAGFVGACLARRLVAEGLRPHVFVQGKTDLWRLKDIQQHLIIHDGDLSDAASVRAMIQDVRPQIIYHLAAHGAYPEQQEAQKIMAVNVMGTLHLLQALEKTDYRLFVNTGSSSEYGFKDTPMRETDVLVPNSFYAAAKAGQTLLAQYAAHAHKKPIVTFRLFSVYGPYESPGRLVPTLLRRALKGEDLVMVSPDTARDFIFVEDVLDAFLNTAPLMDHGGEIFNLGSGTQVSLKEMVDEVLQLTGAKVKVHWQSMPLRIWDTSNWVADVSKTKEVLGFQARTSLQDGLAKTLAWMTAHV